MASNLPPGYAEDLQLMEDNDAAYEDAVARAWLAAVDAVYDALGIEVNPDDLTVAYWDWEEDGYLFDVTYTPTGYETRIRIADRTTAHWYD